MVINIKPNSALAAAFQTLGDPNRLRILAIIGSRVCSVSEIVEATGLSQPLVSHHLRILRERKLLDTKRQGPFIYYQLHDAGILEVIQQMVRSLKD